MTKEKAIKTLKGEAWSFGSKEYREAFDMAIKALEQEFVIDKIKNEVRQTRKTYLDMNDIDWLNGCDYVLSVIDKYKAESEK